jgi:hypothetical protein
MSVTGLRTLVLAGCGWVVCLAWPSLAAQPINEALFSPDVSVAIGTVDFTDHDVAFEDFNTAISPFVPVPLPAAVDLSSFHFDPTGNSRLLFTLDVTAELPGSLTVTPRDVVEYDYFGSFSVALDGASLGVPPGVRIDALAIDPASGALVVSFDTTVTLGAETFADEDLVLLDGAPAMLLDGSAVGIDARLDVDGASVFAADVTVVSLDGSGVVGGVAFDDEDLLLYSELAGAWSMVYDASASAAAMGGGADTNAIYVPEPEAGPRLGAGLALLFALARQRARRDRAAWFAAAALR